MTSLPPYQSKQTRQALCTSKPTVQHPFTAWEDNMDWLFEEDCLRDPGIIRRINMSTFCKKTLIADVKIASCKLCNLQVMTRLLCHVHHQSNDISYTATAVRPQT